VIATRVGRAYLIGIFVILWGIGRLPIVPIGVLLGKIPDPPAALMARAMLHGLSIFLVGATFVLLAGKASTKGKHVISVLLLLAAPFMSLLTLVWVGA
jgi:hypothetical protein